MVAIGRCDEQEERENTGSRETISLTRLGATRRVNIFRSRW